MNYPSSKDKQKMMAKSKSMVSDKSGRSESSETDNILKR